MAVDAPQYVYDSLTPQMAALFGRWHAKDEIRPLVCITERREARIQPVRIACGIQQFGIERHTLTFVRFFAAERRSLAGAPVLSPSVPPPPTSCSCCCTASR